MKWKVKSHAWLLGLVAVGLLASCARRQAMYEQPKYTPFKESDFFEDKRAVRPLIPGTVARGHENADDLLNKGTVDGRGGSRSTARRAMIGWVPATGSSSNAACTRRRRSTSIACARRPRGISST